MGLDIAKCYCGSMACGSELAWVSSGAQRDSAPREALYAQRAVQISMGYLRANPLVGCELYLHHVTFSSLPNIFRGAVTMHLLQSAHHFVVKYEAELLKVVHSIIFKNPLEM